VNIITKDNQTLLPLSFEGDFYYVRLVKRGMRLDCSGVYKLEVLFDRLAPEFIWQDRNANKMRRLILVAKQEFSK